MFEVQVVAVDVAVNIVVTAAAFTPRSAFHQTYFLR